MAVRIGDRLIGKGQPCFIIAEAGSNHDRDLGQAKKLIDIAAEAGADAVKFQTFEAGKIAAATRHEIAKLGNEFGTVATLYELYQGLELPREWQAELAAYAAQKGILFLSTPFDYAAVDQLNALDMPVFKIASFEMVDLPFLKYVAGKGKPVILSTGMAAIGEVEEAVSAVYSTGNRDLILLHCGINYPAAFSDVHLAAMDTLAQAFQVPVGYSDHTPGITVPIAAVARGATVIEKHFTLDRNLKGPDHKFALNPEELRAMVQGIREVEAAIGSPVKQMAASEGFHRRRARRSIFAKVDIPAGTPITAEMLAILRPGIGLMPKYIDLVVGRIAQVDIMANEPVTWEKI